MKAKYCIIVVWKTTGVIEVYNNLKSFTNKFTAYSYDSISNYMSRKKEAFTDADVTVERKEIIT
jgi:hypothetical protein